MVRWLRTNPPKNRSEAMAVGAVLSALIFACLGCEIAAWVDSDLQYFGVIGGFIFGVAVALIGIRWYLARQEQQTSAASQDGPATDPKLYNVPDDDL